MSIHISGKIGSIKSVRFYSNKAAVIGTRRYIIGETAADVQLEQGGRILMEKQS